MLHILYGLEFLPSLKGDVLGIYKRREKVSGASQHFVMANLTHSSFLDSDVTFTAQVKQSDSHQHEKSSVR